MIASVINWRKVVAYDTCKNIVLYNILQYLYNKNIVLYNIVKYTPSSHYVEYLKFLIMLNLKWHSWTSSLNFCSQYSLHAQSGPYLIEITMFQQVNKNALIHSK